MSKLVQLRTREDGPVILDENAPKLYVETYGCQMNVADTNMVKGVLDGYSMTKEMENADLILINTCAVREKAEERIFARLAELKVHKRSDAVLGVIGCMAEHLKKSIVDQVPEVDLVIGPDAYRRLPALVEEAKGGESQVDVKLDKEETYSGIDPAVSEGGVSGFVTIQRGCDKFCTFCVVPFTRGRERGVAPREVLARTRALVAAGYKEITLLGQTVNSYKFEDVTFADLIRTVAKVDGVERLRFTSPYPVDFGADVIAAIAENPVICPQVHLPLQSGSDAVLSRMKRGYTIGQYLEIVDNLRAAVPDIAFSTDIMTGFCGETDEDHQQTLDVMKRVRFDSAFMFKYSERSLTNAAKKLPDDISEAMKKSRITDIIRLQETISKEVNQKQIGMVHEVLVEGPSKRNPEESMGRTPHFKTVILDKSVPAGTMVKARIESANMATLKGVVVDVPSDSYSKN